MSDENYECTGKGFTCNHREFGFQCSAREPEKCPYWKNIGEQKTNMKDCTAKY